MLLKIKKKKKKKTKSERAEYQPTKQTEQKALQYAADGSYSREPQREREVNGEFEILLVCCLLMAVAEE